MRTISPKGLFLFHICQKAFKIKLFLSSELFENSEIQETWQCIKNRKIDSQDKKCRKSVVKTVSFFQFLRGVSYKECEK